MKAPRMRTFSSLTIFACFCCLLTQSAFSQTTTYSIFPNPATVSESGGILLLTIVRSGNLPAEALRVSTTTGEGFSNDGDYTNIFTHAVAFSSGQQSQSVSVNIIDDTTIETNETFGFIVQAKAGQPNTTYLAKSTFTIIDDDPAQPTYFISPKSGYASEDSENYTFEIVRTGPTPAGAVVVDILENEGYANVGDYERVTRTIPFATGQRASGVSVRIYDDKIAEYDETFGIILEPIGGTNTLDKGTFTILDDDRAFTPLITNPTLIGTTFTLNVDSQDGFEDVLEYKNALDAAVWTAVQTNSGNSGMTIGLTNTGVVNSSRFYRVRVQQLNQE